MLELLCQLESELCQHLKDKDSWNSVYVYVDYHKPYVKRLWKQIGENRIYLHEIFPCKKEESLYHPHPWPSAMKVISGSYEMGLGYSESDEAPEFTTKFILSQNSYYEMDAINAWHYVRPLDNSSFSLMITGVPWQRSAPKSSTHLRELTLEEKNRIFNEFEKIYF